MEIGFNPQKELVLLKDQGITDENIIKAQISIKRTLQLQLYLEAKKIEDALLLEAKSQQIIRANTSKTTLASPEILAEEKAALIALYNSTNGSAWTNTINNKGNWPINDPNSVVTSWNSNNNTGWYGVDVNPEGRVTSLRLEFNNLTGYLSNLNSFTELSTVFLHSNKMQGGNLNSFSELTKLSMLNIQGCKLEGNLTSIMKSVNLLIFNAVQNSISGSFPDDFNRLSKLQSLGLTSNQLEGEYAILGQIPTLRFLTLSNNNFNKIGSDNYNNKSVPDSFKNLINITTLTLEGAGLKNNIDILGYMVSLNSLYLGNNKIEGPLPLRFSALNQLTYISVGGSKITDISSLNNITTLIMIDAQSNLITSIPIGFTQFPNLSILNFSGNQISGSLINLTSTQLTTLYINQNNFRFVDIEPVFIKYKNIADFQYFNQGNTDTVLTINRGIGSSVTLSMSDDGIHRYTDNDKFKWYKGNYPNGTLISQDESRQITITNLNLSHAGNYYCLSTHPQITNSQYIYQNLILRREPIRLQITNCTTTEGSITSPTDKFHTNGESSFAFESTATGLTYEWSVTPANGTATSNTLDSYTHTFTEAGDYEVKLVATDANGCSTTFTKPVKVEDRYCANEPIDFAFNTTETNLTYNWTSTDSLGNIVHRETNATGLYTFTPQVAGEYVIELVASSATSCKTLFSKNVIVDQCTPYISCTKDNPLSPEIHSLFINLIGKLASTPTGANVNVYAHKEIAAVAPYTADKKATIYNFTNTTEAISFSFSATAAENEIYIPKSASGSVTAINLDKYKDALTSTIVATSYNSGATNNSDGHVRNIDFCPKELSCVSHIALVVDESGSLDFTEINKIKKQLKLFVARQAFTNDDIGSNIHVSITGMSDSDANTRTDFIAPTKMTAGNVGMFNAWIDKLGKRYGDTGISQASDYWKSGLDGALAYTMKPTFVLMITDGSQTANVQGLKETFTKFDNNNKTVTDPKLPHLYVVGIENGNYVDRDSYTSKLSRDLDPNYNPSLGSNNSLTAKTTPLLTKSLQYLLGLSATQFPVSDINQFNVGTYFGHSNFDLLASDETYFADKVVTGEFACGTPAIKDFCDDCFSFKPEPGKEYILSAWVKEESVDQVKTYTNPVIQLVFYNNKEALDIKAQKIDSLSIKASGDIIDGWQRVVQKFKIPTNTITIGIELENLSPSIPVYFDDIRIHPLQGSVKSFVYDPETFKLMSELDENNYSTFYEYDNEGGLVRVKKETAKGVKTIQETRSGNVINATTTNP